MLEGWLVCYIGTVGLYFHGEWPVFYRGTVGLYFHGEWPVCYTGTVGLYFMESDWSVIRDGRVVLHGEWQVGALYRDGCESHMQTWTLEVTGSWYIIHFQDASQFVYHREIQGKGLPHLGKFPPPHLQSKGVVNNYDRVWGRGGGWNSGGGCEIFWISYGVRGKP